MNFIDDIPHDLATAAHRGTSFVPEERADQERSSYAKTLAADFEYLSKFADTDDKRATLFAEFRRYREGYRTRYTAMLEAKSRCVSWMIAGRSNFPVSRQQKLGRRADARTGDVVSYREHALAVIRRALTPELQPIKLGDNDADARIREKLQKLEALADQMKACNVAIRKHAKAGAEAQIQALLALGYGFTEEQARQLLKPDFAGRIGFADYELTNRRAEIRRLKSRLTVVERNAALPHTEAEGTIARIEDAPSENRIRIFFPGKPEPGTRTQLKQNGFRWTPSLGCWQAYRGESTTRFARAIAGVAA